MNKIISAFAFSLCAICANAATYNMSFDDGLPVRADSTEYTTATDRNGRDSGIYQYEYFYIDVNNDTRPDRITRGRYTSPTSAYTFYRIEIQGPNRKYDRLPITDFQTIENYGCFFRVFKFGFSPRFTITAASRDVVTNCVTPTAAKLDIWELVNGELVKTGAFTALPTTDARLLLN